MTLADSELVTLGAGVRLFLACLTAVRGWDKRGSSCRRLLVCGCRWLMIGAAEAATPKEDTRGALHSPATRGSRVGLSCEYRQVVMCRFNRDRGPANADGAAHTTPATRPAEASL